MKKMICEMCNGTEFVKEGDFFVCQGCGIKYTADDAKKMVKDMGEENTEQKSNAQENTTFVEKCLTNARRAKQKEDWDEAEKYYNMVEQNDPTNIEAVFYSSYAKARVSLTVNDIYKRQAVFKILQNCLSLIDENFKIENEEMQFQRIEQITIDIINMVCSGYVFTEWKNSYGTVTKTDKGETENLFISLLNGYSNCLLRIFNNYEISQTNKIKTLYMIIKLQEFKRDNLNLSAEGKDRCNNDLVKFHNKIKEMEPEHVVPVFSSAVEEEQRSNKKNTTIIVLCVVGVAFLLFVSCYG